MSKEHQGTIEQWYMFGNTVVGHIYGSPHPQVKDGMEIRTSRVVGMNEKETVLETKNSFYTLGEKYEAEKHKPVAEGRYNPLDIVYPDDYQLLAARTAIYPAETGPEYLALGLTSEAGEVAGKIKKQIRDGHSWTGEQRVEARRVIIKELGDCCWYIVMLCKEYNVSFLEVLRMNIKKLYDRQQRGTLGGDGDNR